MNAPILPTINALLNACAAFCLVMGWLAIRGGRARAGIVDERRRVAHRNWMAGALASSALFLACYLYYHANYPPVTYRGPARPFYLVLLISHIVLAAGMVPFVLRAAWLAARGDYARHARLARYAWPVWMYVSATGIAVYVLLYGIG